VLARQGELRGGQGRLQGNRPQTPQGIAIAGRGGTVKRSGLAAELVQVGPAGKLPHEVSSFTAEVRDQPLREDT
jgi:hypothetical protein